MAKTSYFRTRRTAQPALSPRSEIPSSAGLFTYPCVGAPTLLCPYGRTVMATAVPDPPAHNGAPVDSMPSRNAAIAFLLRDMATVITEARAASSWRVYSRIECQQKPQWSVLDLVCFFPANPCRTKARIVVICVCVKQLLLSECAPGFRSRSRRCSRKQIRPTFQSIVHF